MIKKCNSASKCKRSIQIMKLILLHSESLKKVSNDLMKLNDFQLDNFHSIKNENNVSNPYVAQFLAMEVCNSYLKRS